jgi:hypothetical protein
MSWFSMRFRSCGAGPIICVSSYKDLAPNGAVFQPSAQRLSSSLRDNHASDSNYGNSDKERVFPMNGAIP